MRLRSRTAVWTCGILAALSAAPSPLTAADNAAAVRARARLEAARAAADANPTKANRLAEDRALAEFNATIASVTGSVTLRRIIAPAAVAESEPNDTSGTADPLNFGTNPGASASASINPAGDVDFFSFTAPANARLWGYVDTGGTQNVGANSRDSILQFIDSDETTVLETDDDDGSGNGLDGTQETGLASSIANRAGPPGGGTVYARINAFDTIPLDQIIDPYTLYVVTTTSEAAEVEPNDTAGTATALYAGVPHVGVRTGLITAVGPPADVTDFYSVSANANDILYISLDGDPTRAGSSEDFELELLSTDGSTILFSANSDSDEPLSEGFAFQVTSTGTFYIRVFDNGNSESGDYTLMAANMSQNVQAKDTIGIRDANNNFFLRNSNSNGAADTLFTFGTSTDVPLAGDWDNDGTDTIGVYRPSTGEFFLRNSNTTGPADVVFTFGGGGAGIVPITGDWDANGSDTIGLYIQSSGVFFLRNSNSSGPADVTFTYGGSDPDYRPLSGDWDGDGDDTVGLYVQDTGVFFLRNSNTNGAADLTFTYGAPDPNYRPIVGDWDSEGTDTIGLYNFSNGIVFLRNTNSNGSADVTFQYGAGGATPLAGDWDNLP